MNKRQVIREIKRVMAGYDHATTIVITKEDRGYSVYKTTVKVRKAELDENQIVFSHCCNDCTLAEAEECFEHEWSTQEPGWSVDQ